MTRFRMLVREQRTDRAEMGEMRRLLSTRSTLHAIVILFAGAVPTFALVRHPVNSLIK
jgi:hypothetical protein